MDELKQAWAELDRRLNVVAGEVQLVRAQTASRRLSSLPLFELAMNLLAALLLGGSYAGHLDQPLYLACAAVLQAGAIVLCASNIWQLAMIGSLDWGAPVTRVARRLERLRAQRLFVTKWILILAPLVWAPLSVVLAVVLLGQEPPIGWLIANVAFGAIAAALLIAVARRHASSGSPWVRRLMDDIAGRNLTAAIAFLGEVERFEED